jgi:proteasome accessory factor B
MCSRADAGQQRVHTVSRKSERLVNLTIALLATKRYLTKSEIFRTVEGYEGSAEAMERMFERDKDDLRGLGIVIELGTFDPLFEDEAGYRITPSSYQLNLGTLDGRDIALLSLAASSWSGAAMEEVSTSALVKLESIGIDADLESISLSPRIGATNSVFTAITDAIMRRSIVTFDYVSADLTVSTRELHPFALRGRSGSWFLIAFDVNKGEQRTFRLDRIAGEVSVGKKSGAFTTPSILQEESTEDQPVATVLLRKNRGNQFRAKAISIEIGDEWDSARVPIFSHTWILSLILWHRDDVVVIEPQSLRQETIRALQEVKSAHG